MQCPSCQFENMPGMKQCARCMARLDIGEIDVHPPRAKRPQKRSSNSWRWRWTVWRKSAAETIKNAALPGTRQVAFQGGFWEWLALLVGGLNQTWRGERFGKIWLAAWLTLLLLSVVFAGTDFGAVILGLLFATHIASVIDLFFRQWEELSTRFRFVLLTALMLGCVYWGTSQALAWWVRSFQFRGVTADLQAGQVLWYFPRAICRVGDIAFYRTNPTAVPGLIDGAPAQFRIVGDRANRVIAQAGDRVRWDGKQFFVNEVSSRWQPGKAMLPLVPFELTVPPHSFYMLPEALLDERLFGNQGVVIRRLEKLESVGIVGLDEIHGRVFLRSYPFNQSRWFPRATE